MAFIQFYLENNLFKLFKKIDNTHNSYFSYSYKFKIN